MKIIILGAGQVGGSLALSLASEANDITLVDLDPVVLREIQDRADLQTIAGHASHPGVLERAGARDASMVVALTNSDETNMVACQVAYTLFHTPTKIARVRAADYLAHQELFMQEALPVDVLISPEQLVSKYIQDLIAHPGSLQVLGFANDKVQMVALRVGRSSNLLHRKISDIHSLVPEAQCHVVGLFRDGRALALTADMPVQAHDELFFLASRSDAKEITNAIQGLTRVNKSVMIAGGGNIGLDLAKLLESHVRVKIIERDAQRARYLSEELEKTIVLHGDAADEDLLLEENIEYTDVFCSLTNDDQANILSAMLAKRLGARKVMSLINRPSYAELVESGMVDIAISPQQITMGALLAYIRKGDVVAVHSVRRGSAEALEAVAHGDAKTSKVVGKRIDQIKLPKGVTIGAITRDGDEVLMAQDDLVIEADDHVIMFLADKSRISDVERLFQVSATFI